MDDLQITQEDNQLVIRGRQKDDSEGRVFLHRGIAARQFQRAFVLAEGIEVEGAWLDNGLLHVDLRRPQPEARVKTIQINGPLPGLPAPWWAAAAPDRCGESDRAPCRTGVMGPSTGRAAAPCLDDRIAAAMRHRSPGP